MINLLMQLSHGEGLNKIVVFSGLSHPIVLHPTLHGEPLLTAQAFYYLDQLASVAHVQYDYGNPLTSIEFEYLVDNYLFEYSKLHQNSRITSRISSRRFWEEDLSDFYLWSDDQLTERLAVDQLNDKSVLLLEAGDAHENVDLSNWDIARTYVESAFDQYQAQLAAVMGKKVRLVKNPSTMQHGYVGLLRVIKPGYGLVDYQQARHLENLSYARVGETATTVRLGDSVSADALDELSVERISGTKKYNPVLLGYFLGALKEDTPLRSFVGFYNVLEFYFEEAPRLTLRTAKTELEQLKSVILWLVAEDEVRAAVSSLSPRDQVCVKEPLKTSSGVDLPALNLFTGSSREELARWLYSIRCAVVHSKKTRKGSVTPSFQPYSREAQSLSPAIPLLRWLAVLCIEKDEAMAGEP